MWRRCRTFRPSIVEKPIEPPFDEGLHANGFSGQFTAPQIPFVRAVLHYSARANKSDMDTP
jgi:hypothetical protein